MISTDIKRTIEIATSQNGVVERPVNLTKYGEWFGWNGVAWCAIFVSWCFAMAGHPLPPLSNKKGIAYVPLFVQYAKDTGMWRPKSSGYRPKAGDLIIYQFTNRPDHVGIVLGVLNDGRIWTIEGNTNAAGSRTGGMVAQLYRRSGILGYVEVKDVAPNVDYAALRRWVAGDLFNKIQQLPVMWFDVKTGQQHIKSPEDVKILRQALNLVLDEKLPVDGIYDADQDWQVQRLQKNVNKMIPNAITENLGTFGDQTKMYLAAGLANIRDGKAR